MYCAAWIFITHQVEVTIWKYDLQYLKLIKVFFITIIQTYGHYVHNIRTLTDTVMCFQLLETANTKDKLY